MVRWCAERRRLLGGSRRVTFMCMDGWMDGWMDEVARLLLHGELDWACGADASRVEGLHTYIHTWIPRRWMQCCAEASRCRVARSRAAIR